MADTTAPRRRLRSGTVVLGGVGILAVALTACSSDPDKRCVDRDSYNAAKGYKVVADKDCKSTKSTKISTDAAWYYGGKKKGSWVDGGSFTKPKEGSSRSTGTSGGSSGGSGVDRGGLGSDSDSGTHKGGSSGG